MAKQKLNDEEIERKILMDAGIDPDSIKPGEFSEIIVINKKGTEKTEEEKYREKIEKGKIKPHYSRDLISQYNFFRKNIYEPKRVFYPCCDIDASPIKGFPNSEVVLMDKEDNVARIMEINNINNFVHGDVLKYKPERPYDLVIILNPQLKSKDLTRHLVKGDYVLANNWHNNVSQLIEDKRFNGIGTILKDKNNKTYLAKGDFSIFDKYFDLFGVFQKIK